VFGIDGAKLIVIALVALVVIGPRDLPRALAKLGKTIGNLRRMADRLRYQFDEMIKDTGLDEVQSELRSVRDDLRCDR
jgi:sec-independent protein translocase protein TatB